MSKRETRTLEYTCDGCHKTASVKDKCVVPTARPRGWSSLLADDANRDYCEDCTLFVLESVAEDPHLVEERTAKDLPF